ncbi:Mpp10 protein [Amylocystis lapponica]|nr:Mpp10 protein [Amylocystis lapponica]
MAGKEDVALPSELAGLSAIVDETPEIFGTGSSELQLAALRATKYVYDLALRSEARSRAHIAELLSSISPDLAPQTRSQTSKRKRSPDPRTPANVPALRETPLTELFVDGMSEDQLWAQLELRAKNVCDVLEYVLDGAGVGNDSDDDEDGVGAAKKRKLLVDGGLDMELDMDEDMMGLDSEDEDEEEEEDGDSESDDTDESEDEGAGEDGELDEAVVELRDPSDEEEDLHLDLDLDRPSSFAGGKRKAGQNRKHGGHPELDDGFFDLAEFNAETEAAEARAVSKGRLGKDDSDEDEDEDEPVDLTAPVDDDPLDEEDDPEGDPTEPFYKDFFDPPPRISGPKPKKPPPAGQSTSSPNGKVRFHEEVRVRQIKAKGKGLPVSFMYEDDDDDGDDDEYGETMAEDDSDEESEILEDDDDNMEAGDSDDDSLDEGGFADDVDSQEEDGRDTIQRLKDDIFADEEETQSGLSTHEKRMAVLQEEIAALEAENVAKKSWTLMGEASSRSRPENALLEEDLEFERVMKSVPIITEELVHSLEERIKARILEGMFDDVVRRRAVEDKPFLPSRFFELQDTKSKQSLAEIYEDEYTAARTGGVAGDDRDGKLKKEHDEIEKLWENISGKLDALCNAHFTPKTPKTSIITVSNVAAATLESALPTTMSTSTMLAPEEIFAPSSSDLRARSELTPTEKRALRNKQKKVKKKARDTLEKSVDKLARSTRAGGIKKQKEAALKSIVKSGKGVTVVGKKSKDEKGKGKRTAAF